ncbi:MAG: hypothetical protein OD918_08430 [Gammaproteobacteria bacterium]
MIEFFANLAEHAPVLAGAIVGAAGAIFGATAALAGGFFITMYNNRQQSKREERKELRAKLLIVALEISKIRAWVIRALAEATGSKQEIMEAWLKIKPGPTEKIIAIASLYFPAIYKEARMLDKAFLEHESVTHKVAHMLMEKNSSLSPEDVIAMQQPTIDGIRTAAEELKKASRELMKCFLTEKRTTAGKIRFWSKKPFRRD